MLAGSSSFSEPAVAALAVAFAVAFAVASSLRVMQTSPKNRIVQKAVD
jgi:hypothetical protein